MIENSGPGSIDSFKREHPDASYEEILDSWTKELMNHRQNLANYLGVSVDELHGTGISPSEQNVSFDGDDAE